MLKFISRFEKFLMWTSEHLSEIWLFSMAVFLLWRPAFPERLQNGICIAGLMSVATTLVRIKKIDQKLDDIKEMYLISEGREQEKIRRKLKKS